MDKPEDIDGPEAAAGSDSGGETGRLEAQIIELTRDVSAFVKAASALLSLEARPGDVDGS